MPTLRVLPTTSGAAVPAPPPSANASETRPRTGSRARLRAADAAAHRADALGEWFALDAMLRPGCSSASRRSCSSCSALASTSRAFTARCGPKRRQHGLAGRARHVGGLGASACIRCAVHPGRRDAPVLRSVGRRHHAGALRQVARRRARSAKPPTRSAPSSALRPERARIRVGAGRARSAARASQCDRRRS